MLLVPQELGWEEKGSSERTRRQGCRRESPREGVNRSLEAVPAPEPGQGDDQGQVWGCSEGLGDVRSAEGRCKALIVVGFARAIARLRGLMAPPARISASCRLF